MEADDIYSSFWDHVEDLRQALIKMIAIVACGTILCFACYRPIIAFLLSPQSGLQQTLPVEQLQTFRVTNSTLLESQFLLPKHAVAPTELPPGVKKGTEGHYWLQPNSSLDYILVNKSNPLVVLGPLEGFSAALKISFWVGCFITSPIWLFLAMQFIAPGLRKDERKLIIPFLISSLVLIGLGFAFAFTVTIPLANHYLTAFSDELAANFWSLGNYLDYSLFLLLANGVAFELCAIGFFAVHLGIVGVESLAAKRRIAIIGALILGALLTPPDVLTQLLLAIPLMVLYEAIILYARILSKHRQENC